MFSLDGQIYVGGCGQENSAQAVLTMSEHCGPYYLFCEVYGKTDQIEIVDEATLFNQISSNEGLSMSVYDDVVNLVDRKLKNNNKLTQLQHFDYLFSPNTRHTLTFVPTTKHNVSFMNNNRIVCVSNLNIRSSYTFINAPMTLNDVLICKVINCDANISSILLFGLTTCNPMLLQDKNLSEDTQELVKQCSSSRWFIDNDISTNISMFDELAFWFDSNGRVYFSVNNCLSIRLRSQIPTSELTSLTLYPFFDLYGQVTSLCLYNFGTGPELDLNSQSNGRTVCLICFENIVNTQLLPCQCTLCNQCATAIKQPSLLADCPFDRKHITQIRPLP